jgi:hypothetical protein
MTTAKVYDPDQTRNEFIAKKRRQRRLQLVPPMSYWNKYAEMTDDDEFCRAINEVMDMFMKPFLILVPVMIIALLSYHLHLLWLPIVTIIVAAPLFWWHGWGSKKYE